MMRLPGAKNHYLGWRPSRQAAQLAAALVAAAILLAGCGMAVKMGRLPDINQLQSLKLTAATKDDVQNAIGPPRGKGRVMFPNADKPRDLWYYYYGEATMSDAQQMFLFVYFDRDRYDGYMWFSSLPKGITTIK
jgi:hypothetical protein